MRRTVLIVAIAISVSCCTMSAASAADMGRLGGTPPTLGVGLLVSVAGSGGSGHESYAADDPHAPRPLFTRAIPSSSGHGGGLSNLCVAPDGPTGPGYELGNGWNFYIELFSTATGRLLGTIATVCVAFDPETGLAVPAAPTVAQPPTIGEIWRSVGLPTPPVGASPDGKGITGLPTWVWTQGSPPVAVAANLLGYRVTGTARVVGFGVYPGEGGWVRGNHPGGPGDPAFAHTYEHTGTYRLGVATLWTAVAVMTGPGLDTPITINLGTAIVTNGRDYPVAQIRSQLL